MGVMVPCHEILAKAKEVNADMVGLSGWLTPSLEEMQYVAGEMDKDEYFRSRQTPLLIGGATCSRVHTAVKIAPQYNGPVIYVPDAVAQRGRGAKPAGREPAPPTWPRVAADYDTRAPTARQAQEATPVALWPRPAPICHAAGLCLTRPRGPACTGPARVQRLRPGRDRHSTSTGAPFFRPGPWPARYPAILDDEMVGVRGAQGLCRRPGHAQKDHRRPLAAQPMV